jgi:squalene cyclase
MPDSLHRRNRFLKLSATHRVYDAANRFVKACSISCRRRSATAVGTAVGAWPTSTKRSWRLRGLRASGESGVADAIRRGADWIVAIQNHDGGWGESCASYLKDQFVGGPSTPSQTAWGILGLLAGGHGGPAALQRGLAHLIETQRADGEWDESLATGTGFPNVFYLRFTLYRNYFPLLALVQARTELGG